MTSTRRPSPFPCASSQRTVSTAGGSVQVHIGRAILGALRSLLARIRRWLVASKWQLLGIAWVAAILLGLAGFFDEAAKICSPPSHQEFLLQALQTVLEQLSGRDATLACPRASGELAWAKAPWTWVYLTAQLFILESGAVVSDPGLTLNLARFAAPVVAAWTVLESLALLLQQRVRAYRLARARRHVVICGLGQTGWHLARRFLEQQDRVVAVERDPTNVHIVELIRRGGLVVIGDATDRKTLHEARVPRAAHVIAVCGDDSANAGVAAQAFLAVASAPPGRTGSRSVGVHAHVEDPTLREVLGTYELQVAAQHPRIRPNFFNVYEEAAFELVEEHLRLDAQSLTTGGGPRVLVVGLGLVGQRVIAQAARHWSEMADRGDRRLSIVAVGADADSTVDALKVRSSSIKGLCDITPITPKHKSVDDAAVIALTRPAPGAAAAPFTHAYVCLEDEGRGLAVGLTLVQHLPDSARVVVAVSTLAGGVAELVKGASHSASWLARLRVFGVLDGGCTTSIIKGGRIERLAQAIHEGYLEKQLPKAATARNRASLVPWERLDEVYKESNRKQAIHTYEKLGTIGFDIKPLTDADADGPGIELNDQQVEDLARLEHERYVKERRDTIKDPSSDPTMAAWQDLGDEDKAKDRETVRRIPHYLKRVRLKMVPRAGSPPAPQSPPTPRTDEPPPPQSPPAPQKDEPADPAGSEAGTLDPTAAPGTPADC
jgi:hypothetical protein